MSSGNVFHITLLVTNFKFSRIKPWTNTEPMLQQKRCRDYWLGFSSMNFANRR